MISDNTGDDLPQLFQIDLLGGFPSVQPSLIIDDNSENKKSRDKQLSNYTYDKKKNNYLMACFKKQIITADVYYTYCKRSAGVE